MTTTLSLAKAIRPSYKLSQKYLNKVHKPLVVGFSAVPGSGKTTLSERLVLELESTRVCRDEIRNVIKKYDPSLALDIREEVLNAITRSAYEEIYNNWPNKRIILDSSLDRTYFETREYVGALTPIYLIRIVPIWEELEKRIRLRRLGAEAEQKNLAHMNIWKRDWENLGMKVEPDYIWDQAEKDLEAVVREISQQINIRFSE